jgi:hypothetical protein
MKSDYKIIFNDNKIITLFCKELFNAIKDYKTWFKSVDWHTRKNILYVYTCGYCGVINILYNLSYKYHVEIVKRKNK